MVDALSQAEADWLIGLEKHAKSAEKVELPDYGGKVSAELVSADGKEHFLLDVHRARIDLKKGTNQLRTRQVFVLVRLDFNGPGHRNPDDEEIPSPHIHIYRQGWGDKWARPAPTGIFTDFGDHWTTLQQFMVFCSVTKPPNFERGLFS
jgi:hypothetical protein